MAERRTIIRAAILVAGVLIAVTSVAPIVARYLSTPPDQRLVDLDVYRTSGQVLLRGAPLYGFLTQAPQLLPFTYPPFAALLAVPLALMSWPAAQWVWVIGVYAALTVAVLYAFRNLLARSGQWAPLVAGALVGACAWMMPISDQIRFGQVDVFLVALCVADCAAPRARWPRGALIGLATAIKLVPGVFLIYLLITGRRLAFKNAVLTAVVATAATWALLPWDSYDFWFGALFDSGRVGANNGTTNQAIKGMLLRLYWPDALTSLVWVVLAALIAYCGFRYARRLSWLADSLSVGTPSVSTSGASGASIAYDAEMGGIAITGLLAVLVSPIAWIHHLSWVVLALGALAGSGRSVRRCALALGVWIFYVLPIPWWGTRLIGPGHPVVVRFAGRIVQDGYGLGAVALVCGIGGYLYKSLRSDSESHRLEGPRSGPEIGTLTP